MGRFGGSGGTINSRRASKICLSWLRVDTHFYGARRVQHVGGLNGAVLGEGVWQGLGKFQSP